jgi:hypothetical protein
MGQSLSVTHRLVQLHMHSIMMLLACFLRQDSDWLSTAKRL